MVISPSGDGGFAALVSELGAALAARGYGVLLLKSRSYLSSGKNPEQTAVDVARLASAALERWQVDSFALVGYSRGADMAPFASNHLPPPLRARLSGIAMLGLSLLANFELHLLDLIKYSQRDSDLPILPDLQRLAGLPMLCVYGREEEPSACQDAPQRLLRREALSRGHHFDGDQQGLASIVLQLLEGNAPASPELPTPLAQPVPQPRA